MKSFLLILWVGLLLNGCAETDIKPETKDFTSDAVTNVEAPKEDSEIDWNEWAYAVTSLINAAVPNRR